MNLNKIVEEWVDKQYFYDENLKRNLKSNIPQLTERIVEEIDNKFDKYGATDTTREIYQSIKKDIIKSLTE